VRTYTATIPAIRLNLPDKRGRRKRHDLIGCYVKCTRAQIRANVPRWARYCLWRDHVRLIIKGLPWPRGVDGARCKLTIKVYWGWGRRGDSVNVLKSLEDVFNKLIWSDDRDVAGQWMHPETDRDNPRVEIRLEVQ